MNLYHYAIRNDKILLFLASIAAIIGGALTPMMAVLLGGLAGTFRSFLLGDISDNQFTNERARFSLYSLPRYWRVCHGLHGHGRFRVRR